MSIVRTGGNSVRKKGIILRIVLVAHRYLAVAVGLLMTLWCVSGFVMMYQEYPELTDAERLAGLEPLDLAACCSEAALDAPDDAPLPQFRIEMLRGEPMLRFGGRRGGFFASAVSLRTGEPLEELGVDEVLAVAAQHARGNGIGGVPRLIGQVEEDQWTISTARRNQPAYRIAFDDPGAHEIYISGASGEVFQQTNRRTRVLAWLGAIPHWLYPLELRRHGEVWLQVVIWTSILGTFLAATGMYVGISRFRRRGRHGRPGSPFFGWWYWHHVSGLVFGVLALTWVFSGLMTVNPWGALSGGGVGARYQAALTGTATWGELKALLDVLTADSARVAGVKQLRAAPFDGRLYVHAMRSDGTSTRLDSGGTPELLSAADVESALAKLGIPVRERSLLEREDGYYYGRKRTVELPVYRTILDDEERTRLYFTPQAGEVRAVGATGRMSRWVRTGLHGLDFPVLRQRPLWDVAVILLLAGVTLVCVTGSWMAVKRVARDFRRWRRVAKRALAPARVS